MKNQIKNKNSQQRRMVVEMINAGFRLSEKLGRHNQH
jgi:hypothetical protein